MICLVRGQIVPFDGLAKPEQDGLDQAHIAGQEGIQPFPWRIASHVEVSAEIDFGKFV